jgi:hypothetical protein
MTNKFEKQIEEYRKLIKDGLPNSWNINEDNTEVIMFRNKHHFVSVASKLEQKEKDLTGISYDNAVKELKAGTGTIEPAQYETIKAKVKENLIARTLISPDISKGYSYSHEGENLDMSRYLEGNPECYFVPKKNEKIHFYKLFVDGTVHAHIDQREYQDKMAQLLATIELLETRNIFIEVNFIISIKECGNGKTKKINLLTILPLFSYKEHKTIEKMSSVMNIRYLRKFHFAILETLYGEELEWGYGKVNVLPNTINLEKEFDYVKFAEDILDSFILPCEPRS